MLYYPFVVPLAKEKLAKGVCSGCALLVGVKCLFYQLRAREE